MKNFFKHLKTVLKHKWWVFHYCHMFGITWRGIVHDISKFSPTEFFESVKYYSGTRSPIDACKEDKGYSMAWLHHKGRNKHHYEYWQDNFDSGGTPLQMPFKESVEMLCDYLGAARAYMGDSFTYQKEIDWWNNKKSKPLVMHPVNKEFITTMLNVLPSLDCGDYRSSRKHCKEIALERYIACSMTYNVPIVIKEAVEKIRWR